MSGWELFVLTTATGFVAGGLIGSLYRLITDRPVGLELLTANGLVLPFNVTALVLAGPTVIMQNAIRARIVEGRPAYWLVFCALISGLWSFLQGVFILHVIIALRGHWPM